MVTEETWFMCDDCMNKYESKYLAKECEDGHKQFWDSVVIMPLNEDEKQE